MSSTYANLPLTHPDKQIRLLRLEQSSSDSDDYHFSLAVHDFHDGVRPSYIAISYTWGDSVPLLPIIVNGKKVRVRFNCWYALWQLRHHGFTDYLWIDSLCINQDNDEEKNFQVGIMGSIYESALWVASCIGTGETIGIIQPPRAFDSDDARVARGSLQARFDQIPYFDRVWIKQEIILARDITLFYGLKKISWEDFDLLIHMEQSLRERKSNDAGGSLDDSYQRWPRNETQIRKGETESPTLQLCNHRSNPSSATFINLVLRYNTAKATVSRDKIYALLSLLPMNDLIRQYLVIDYGQPTFHLFHAIVRLVYSTYGDLENGQKHQVLDMIRQWLDIDEHNPEMDDFLRSIPSSPSDWLPSSTSDLANPWLKETDPHIMLKIMEICPVHRENDLKSDYNLKDEKYAPLTLLERINTWQRDDKKWSKEQINQLVPTNLKTTKFTYIRPDILTIISPSMEEYLVNSDVQAGDFIAKIVWGGSEEFYYTLTTHAVLRPANAGHKDTELGKADSSYMDTSEDTLKGSSNHPWEQEDSMEVLLILHSWAIPVSQELKLLTIGESSAFDNQRLGELKLHHRDALIPLILNNRPLHALMYPASETSYFSTVKMLDDTAYVPQPQPEGSSIRSDDEYLRDILG